MNTREITIRYARPSDLPSQPAPTFAEIATDAVNWDAQFSEMDPVPLNSLEPTEDRLIFGSNSVPMNQDARDRLFEKLGAPSAYLKKRSTDVQILALRDHFRQGDFGPEPKLVLRDGKLFTIRSDNLIELGHVDVLNGVAESLGQSVDSLHLSRIDYADGRLELDLVSPTKTIEVRRGDVVTGGLHIEHSRYGDQATQIQGFVYRLVCENGMTRRECVSAEGIVRIRKLPASHPRGKELLLDQVRRLTARTWQSLEPQLLELLATADRRADVPQLLRQWVQRARFSTRSTPSNGTRHVPTVIDRLLAAWRHWGAEDTYYAAVNALTWVGSHDSELSLRQRRTLSLLGGMLAFSGVHLCPRCSSLISGAAHNSTESATESAHDEPDGEVVDA
jgi:hypothetical protein